MPEFTQEEISSMLQAGQLSVSLLSEEEREILDRIDEEKDRTEETLGRELTDEEAIDIEKGIPGGWAVVEKLNDMIPSAIKEIRRNKVQ
jgi:hypothetical protein